MLPLTGLEPLHPPVAVQLVVLSELHVILAEPPGRTDVGFNAIVNRGLAIVESVPNAAGASRQAAMKVVSSRAGIIFLFYFGRL